MGNQPSNDNLPVDNNSTSTGTNTIIDGSNTTTPSRKPRVLLLGVGHAGKSTLFKAMVNHNHPWKAGQYMNLYEVFINQLPLLVQYLNLSDPHFTSLSSESMKTTALQLLRAPDLYYSELLVPYDPVKDPENVKMWPKPTPQEHEFFRDASGHFNVERYQAQTTQYTIPTSFLVELSQEPAIVSLLPCDYMEKFDDLNDSTGYWWPKRGEEYFLQMKQQATFEDFLRRRIRTTGIAEYDVYYPCPDFVPKLESHDENVDSKWNRKTTNWNNDKNNIAFSLFDTGNQVNERKKWIHAFESVNVMLYVVSLADYCFAGTEELTNLRSHWFHTKGYFEDSVSTFGELAASRWFTKTKFVICLNKYHHFTQKLSQRPFNQFFPDYHGDNEDPEMIIEWIKQQYLNVYDKHGIDITRHDIEFIFVDPFDLPSMGKLIHTIRGYIDEHNDPK